MVSFYTEYMESEKLYQLGRELQSIDSQVAKKLEQLVQVFVNEKSPPIWWRIFIYNIRIKLNPRKINFCHFFDFFCNLGSKPFGFKDFNAFAV